MQSLSLEKPILYVVATPLGNMDDITIRALNTLKESDLILAENPNHSRAFLKTHGIHSEIRGLPKIPTGEENRILEMFQGIEKISLISDAGTPGISDPGSGFIRFARKENWKIIPIPGASALTSILSVSGFQTNPCIYLGFLSDKKVSKIKELEKYSDFEGLIVIFESVHRIISLLEIIRDIFPKSNLLIGREITKYYEEFLYFPIAKDANFSNITEKGEFVILINNRLKKIAKENSRFTETIIE
ncbi:MAG: 16S rRNA (cytidine(1402)-2'-O)-methyltransferase [Leptospiraceae bacterium]|nr:16S rRNA (cytidine(1402)-2'-O)-methyltransferase [Leptospiraceae bacterium]MCK6382463.1 16S rRNA (cytidine(1402)-2'-O)-methyltransferase [Leptospiraceae bacterium]NUM40928.1 16S rRNA (cytidine(1402)-2'-O)-methyltransferase [Leptospiraceae bacterium]